MKTKMDTSVKAALIALAVIVAGCLMFVLYINWALGAPIKPTEILPGENGKCSDRLKEYMKDQYGVYIPDCADFVGGSFNNAPRDAAVYVAFDVKLSDWDEYVEGMDDDELLLLLTKGEDYFNGDIVDNANKNCSEMFDREYEHYRGFSGPHTMGFSYILFSDTEVSRADGVISFAFRATGCGNSFSR